MNQEKIDLIKEQTIPSTEKTNGTENVENKESEMKTVSVSQNGGDVSLRTWQRNFGLSEGKDWTVKCTCSHSHPAGYGEGHSYKVSYNPNSPAGKAFEERGLAD